MKDKPAGGFIGYILFIAVATLVIVAFWGGIAYIIYHFAKKFW